MMVPLSSRVDREDRNAAPPACTLRDYPSFGMLSIEYPRIKLVVVHRLPDIAKTKGKTARRETNATTSTRLSRG
jgi:hypothetical protein